MKKFLYIKLFLYKKFFFKIVIKMAKFKEKNIKYKIRYSFVY